MPWLRLDDKFAQHPKVAELSDRAFRAHVATMLYCSEYVTKGKIPRAALRLTGATEKVIEELVQAGVWEREGDALEVHDFEIYNGATVGERVAAFLKRFPGTSANEVHRKLGGKREVVLSEVARYQSGSQTGSEGTTIPGTPEPPQVVPLAGAREPDPEQTPTPSSSEVSSSGGSSDLSSGRPPEEEPDEDLVSYEEWLLLERQRERSEEAERRGQVEA